MLPVRTDGDGAFGVDGRPAAAGSHVSSRAPRGRTRSAAERADARNRAAARGSSPSARLPPRSSRRVRAPPPEPGPRGAGRSPSRRRGGFEACGRDRRPPGQPSRAAGSRPRPPRAAAAPPCRGPRRERDRRGRARRPAPPTRTSRESADSFPTAGVARSRSRSDGGSPASRASPAHEAPTPPRFGTRAGPGVRPAPSAAGLHSRPRAAGTSKASVVSAPALARTPAGPTIATPSTDSACSSRNSLRTAPAASGVVPLSCVSRTWPDRRRIPSRTAASRSWRDRDARAAVPRRAAPKSAASDDDPPGRELPGFHPPIVRDTGGDGDRRGLRGMTGVYIIICLFSATLSGSGHAARVHSRKGDLNRWPATWT